MNNNKPSLEFRIKLPASIQTPEEATTYRQKIEEDIISNSKENNVQIEKGNLSHTENFGLGEVLIIVQIAEAAAKLFCDRVVPIIRRKHPNFPECPTP